MNLDAVGSGSCGCGGAGHDGSTGPARPDEDAASRDARRGPSRLGVGPQGSPDGGDADGDLEKRHTGTTRPADPGRCVAALRAVNGTVATAESLTGGLVVAALTSVPGSSWVVLGGVVAYCAAVKSAVLGVGSDLLGRAGAVQPEVARQMAVGARTVCGSQWGVSTTGVAGPDAADGQPVGTVFVAISGPDGDEVVALRLSGDREAIRAQSVSVCLDRLTERVEAHVAGTTRYR